MAIVLFDTFKGGAGSDRHLGRTFGNFLSILWGSLGFGVLFGLTASFLTKHAAFHARPRPAMEVRRTPGPACVGASGRVI
jgi:hypothetical protein